MEMMSYNSIWRISQNFRENITYYFLIIIIKSKEKIAQIKNLIYAHCPINFLD